MNGKTLAGGKDIWDILLLFEIYENLLKHNSTLIKGLGIGPKFFADTWPEKVFWRWAGLWMYDTPMCH